MARWEPSYFQAKQVTGLMAPTRPDRWQTHGLRHGERALVLVSGLWGVWGAARRNGFACPRGQAAAKAM